MKFLKPIFLFFLCLFIAFFSYEYVISTSAAPPASRTDAPSESNCTACHTGTIDTGGGGISIVVGNNETQYLLSQTYTITVSVSDQTKSRFGFQLTALDVNADTTAGVFNLTNTTTTTLSSGIILTDRDYVGHKNAGPINTWTFEWMSPDTNIGTIMFYATGNACNNDGNTGGDNVYSTSLALMAPILPVANFSADIVEGCGPLTVQFTDLSTGSPSGWDWTFQGGTPPSSSDQNPLVTFENPGNFNVYLIASNAAGNHPFDELEFITVFENPYVDSSSITDVSCFGETNGSVTIFSNGGTGTISYAWDNLETTSSISGLATGNYSVVLTDANGCQSIADTFEVSSPLSAVQVDFLFNDASCGINDGYIESSPFGGTPPFTYLWSNNQTTPAIFNLTAGSYSVTVTDSSGCSTVASQVIQNSDGPVIDLADVTSVSCNSQANGSISINASGNGTLSYLWSTNEVTAQISGLAVGTYAVTISDDLGCEAFGEYEIEEPEALVIEDNLTEPLCNGGMDGAISLSTEGGVQPYSYNWSNMSTDSIISGLAADSYSCTVSDDNGCTEILSFILFQPNPIGTVMSSTGALTSDGTATVLASGGTPPYTYLWNSVPPQITSEATGLIAGDYEVIVTDANNCSQTGMETVDQILSVNESLNSLIEVFPNPSKGNIFIKSSQGLSGQLTIMNSNGQIVNRNEISINAGEKFGVNSLENYGTGIYFIQIKTDEGVFSSKVMIMSN